MSVNLMTIVDKQGTNSMENGIIHAFSHSYHLNNTIFLFFHGIVELRKSTNYPPIAQTF